MQYDQVLVQNIVKQLKAGIIRFGKLTVDCATPREAVLKALDPRRVGPHQEFGGRGAIWRRYQFESEILWFPPQRLFVAFEGDRLGMVMFADAEWRAPTGDYRLELQNYSLTRIQLLPIFGDPREKSEQNPKAMSVTWPLGRLSLTLACEESRGGASLTLKTR